MGLVSLCSQIYHPQGWSNSLSVATCVHCVLLQEDSFVILADSAAALFSINKTSALKQANLGPIHVSFYKTSIRGIQLDL